MEIVLFFVGLFTTVLGASMFYGSKYDYVNRLYSVSIFFTGTWSISMALFFLSGSEALSYAAMGIYYFSGMMLLAFFYATSVALKTRKVLGVRTWLVLSPVFVAGILSLNSAFVIQDYSIVDKSTITVQEPGYMVYAIIFTAYYCAGLISLYYGYFRSQNAREKRQNGSLLLAFLISGVIGLVVDIFLPFFGDYSLIWVGPFSLIVSIGWLCFVMIRYRLFDLRTAAVRALVYVSVIVFITLMCVALSQAFVYLSPYINLKYDYQGMEMLDVLIALCAMLVFWPLRSVLGNFFDRLFYRNRYKIGDLVAEVGAAMSSSGDIVRALRGSAHAIMDKIHAKYVLFIVKGPEDMYIYGTKDKPYITDDQVDELLTVGRKLNVVEYLEPIINFSNIKNTKYDPLLGKLDVSFIMPIKKSKTHIGVMIVGKKGDGGYTRRDLRALRTISTEVSIAIQNMLSVAKINKMNAELEERVREATVKLRKSNARLREMDTRKDEFMSMASHQLRTPLTSIKGYVSGVLEGDAGDINDMQRMMLGQAFNSSERMVHLVGDLLNLSRIQNGKFVITPVEADLGQVINEEIGNTTPMANDRSITLQTHIDKKIGKVHVDIDKVRQVIMNFIDNAIYYSPPNSTVTVTLTRNKSTVECRVIDKGIGVPKEQREHLFTKFFRADNAKNKRPDGTGIGLFLAKRVIDEHGGEIIFESEEGKGSTFGFILPVKPIKK